MAAARGHRLDIDRVSHRFGDFVAVRDIDLAVDSGEIVALLGPSGCGKSTLLRIIAGFIAQSEGRILFDGEPVDHLKPNHRGVGIVFQNYALFPHMTVRQNVAYGLQARRWDRSRIQARVEEMLDLVQMRTLGDRLPRQLSGGQQQRIALARCLATDPKVLLLDEPFGALDKNLRLDMQIEVKRLQRSYGVTTILVTHDQEEALSMADRIAVMNRGCIEQIASPTEVYDRPSTLFVNRFVGATNILPGEVVETGSGNCAVRIADGIVLGAQPAEPLSARERVWLSVRPERLHLSLHGKAGAIAGEVKAVLPLGAQVAYEIELAGGALCKIVMTRTDESDAITVGSAVHVAPDAPTACRAFRQGPHNDPPAIRGGAHV